MRQFLLLAAPLASSLAFAQVSVDFGAKPTKTSEVPFVSIGSDRAAIFLRDIHQRDLKALQKEMKFKYLRCHGIFNEEMEVVKRNADNSLSFNWTKVDGFIDRLKEVGIRPFIEFGYMPEPLASGKETCFYYRGNTTPPKSQSEWAQLVSEFTEHEIKRFGLKEVRQWYFEVWNEPNHDYFWRGTQADYFKLYETTARAMKAIDPKLRVGGPGTAGLGWIKEFLDFCSQNNVPVDFASTHNYGATQGFVDPDGKSQTILDTKPDAVNGGFAWIRSVVKSSKYPKLPLFITEWGPSYSQADPVHDNYICAAWILEKLSKSIPHTDGMSYWTFSDQFEEGGPVRTPFHGGFGLLNYDGLKKPGFFAYKFFSELKNQQYPSSDERTIATKSGDNLTLITWDYTEPILTEPNNPFFHKDQKPKTLQNKVIQLKGLKTGRYHLELTPAGYMQNDVYGTYLALGKPKGDGPSLDKATQAKLRSATTGRPTVSKTLETDPSGTIRLELPMRTNDCWLIKLNRISS